MMTSELTVAPENTLERAPRGCRHCQHPLAAVERTKEFRPPTGPVTVRLLESTCTHCGRNTLLASQHDENLRRLAARAEAYGPYLRGEDIFAFRRKYGLTQRALSKVIGKGLIAVTRYETESSYPDLSTTSLLKVLMRHPPVLKELADAANVDIPLWRERCNDGALTDAGYPLAA